MTMTIEKHHGRIRLAASELRRDLSTTINRVAFSGERLVLHRHDKDTAAIVSIEDLSLLEAVEDLIDGTAAMEALKSKEPIHDWEELREELGLD
jgi:PHD/YefM family antitoxin component YafN of YafNO toxin-antitoxin module